MDKWLESPEDIFWSQLAPSHHLVQIYNNDAIFLNTLNEFVIGGIKADDCVIVIATAAHLDDMRRRLLTEGYDVDALIADDQYIPLDADEALAKFMADSWPDETLFNEMSKELISRAHKKNRRARAFGEMVAILWAQGNSGATVRLEYLWSDFCKAESLCLFCAYPKSSFAEDTNISIRTICATHSKVIHGDTKPEGAILYTTAKYV